MFITIDGPDGVGKTSVAKQLVEFVNRDAGKQLAVYTAEPTQSDLGRKIRKILQNGTPSEVQRLTQFFIEDRRDHVKEITAQVDSGYIVICDRYRYSTVVYQHMQGEDILKLIALNADFLKPDFSFILNVDSVDILLSHISNRSDTTDLFETRSTLKKAIALYRKMDTYFPDDNVIFINANQSVDKTAALIQKFIWQQKR